MDKKLLYFGCIQNLGHFLYESDNGHSLNIDSIVRRYPQFNKHLLQGLDATFTPNDWNQKEGVYNDCIVPPIRIVAWWDRSFDKRHGSNSALIGYGFSSAEEILDEAVKLFPSVMRRQRRPIPFNKQP